MSKRFPDEMVCPHCGLTVMGDASTGRIRAHGNQAVDAGHYQAECAQSTNRAQELVAKDFEKESAARRRAYWASRDPDPTVVAEGTAQPIRKAKPPCD